MIDWKELFEKQEELDERIIEEHNIQNKNMLPNKIIALTTEFGEMLNEYRVWKFWSKDKQIRKQAMFEEYVDGLHFILSIGNDLGTKNYKYKKPKEDYEIRVLIIGIANMMTTIGITKSISQLLDHYLTLGYKLGLTDEIIYETYMEKNKKNHLRQDEKY